MSLIFPWGTEGPEASWSTILLTSPILQFLPFLLPQILKNTTFAGTNLGSLQLFLYGLASSSFLDLLSYLSLSHLFSIFTLTVVITIPILSIIMWFYVFNFLLCVHGIFSAKIYRCSYLIWLFCFSWMSTKHIFLKSESVLLLWRNILGLI